MVGYDEQQGVGDRSYINYAEMSCSMGFNIGLLWRLVCRTREAYAISAMSAWLVF